MSGPTQRDYQMALDSQSACNLSGLVHSLAEVMPRIWETASGTAEVNRHPIVRLYVHQMAFLANVDTDGYQGYSAASDACKVGAKGPKSASLREKQETFVG